MGQTSLDSRKVRERDFSRYELFEERRILSDRSRCSEPSARLPLAVFQAAHAEFEHRRISFLRIPTPRLDLAQNHEHLQHDAMLIRRQQIESSKQIVLRRTLRPNEQIGCPLDFHDALLT